MTLKNHSFFEYTVTVTNPDGTTTTETATVVVTVTPEEDVMDDAATTPEEIDAILAELTITAAELVAELE